MSELDLPSVLQPTTLDPLTDELRHGLIPVAFFGLFSLLSTTGLFAYLTYRGVVWHHKGQLKDGTNQFVVLIYNLLLADIQQALSFAFSAVYLANDKIEVGTGTCWANGWFNSVGDLASGGFILFIALHTFFAVVKGRRMNNKTFYSCIAGLWIFVFLLPLIAVGRNPHVYVRAGAWVLSPNSPSFDLANNRHSVGLTIDTKQKGYGFTISGFSSASLAPSSSTLRYSYQSRPNSDYVPTETLLLAKALIPPF